MTTQAQSTTVYLVAMGGSSYAGPSFAEGSKDVRAFDESDAEGRARSFWNGYGWGTGRTPCTEDVEIWYFKYDPRGSRDPYPDEVWTRDEDGDPIRTPA